VSPLYQTRRNLCHRCDAGEINGNATRGQALPQLHEIFAGRDQRRLKLLNVSCGTGRFLDFAKQARPPAVGLDMSEAYVKEAKRHLWRWSRINLVVGSGE
jgi:ubiquinone/menaquinone biosynthesis C-methylase UbiE